jgi:hypothetical protein
MRHFALECVLRKPPMDPKQPADKDRINQADRASPQRPARRRRSGEGSASALDHWKSIERDRKQIRPREEPGH